jgi:hypothetical protein
MPSNSESTLFPGSTTADLTSSRRASAPLYGTAADDVITSLGRSAVYAGDSVAAIALRSSADLIFGRVS